MRARCASTNSTGESSRLRICSAIVTAERKVSSLMQRRCQRKLSLARRKATKCIRRFRRRAGLIRVVKSRVMNQRETMFLIGFIAFYLPAFGLFHLMIFRVNQQLAPDRRIPHSLSLGGWNRLAREHNGFYP